MASIDKRPDGRYRARWREYPGGRQKSQHFLRKVDAEHWLVKVQHDLMTGRYVDPRAGRVKLSDFAATWTARQHWRPATRERVDRELRLYILPTFGDRPVASIRRAHVEDWVAELPLAPSSARRVAETLRTLLNGAVADELVAINPAVGAKVPAEEHPPVVPLEVDQILALTHCSPAAMRGAIVLGAGTGLRQGEAMGLTIDRVDFLRREVRVDRQLWTPGKGRPVFAPPKTRRGYRTLSLSAVVLDALSAQLANHGPGQDGLVFHTNGRPVGRATLSQRFRRAAKAAGFAATWHDLRHYHASVLLSAGISPALVAERLGHDLKTLLATYAHVIRSDEDRVRAVVDATLGERAEDFLRTSDG